jgi:hypothetical protein
MVRARYKRANDAERLSVSTCFTVHCFGDLSGRHRSSLVPWRNRPPEK